MPRLWCGDFRLWRQQKLQHDRRAAYADRQPRSHSGRCDKLVASPEADVSTHTSTVSMKRL